MKKFKIEIRETLQKIVEIPANSLDEAIEQIKEKYHDEDIVLYPDDHIDTLIQEYQDKCNLSFDDTVRRIIDFNKARDWDKFHTPVNLAKSISIEGSELLECFQWNDEIEDKEAVEEELADIMNYCIQMANVLGLNIVDIINKKIDKNDHKYPVDKCKGKSTKYNKL